MYTYIYVPLLKSGGCYVSGLFFWEQENSKSYEQIFMTFLEGLTQERQVCNDEICPVCQEAEETTLHLLGKCCALINQRLEILGSHYLEYEDLALLHWRPLLRLAKASKRF